MNELLCKLEQYKLITEFSIALIPISTSNIRFIHRNSTVSNKQEKRFAVFDSINKFIGAIVRKCSVDQQQVNDFLAGTRGAEFLFDENIKKYVDEIWEKSCELVTWDKDEYTSTHASEIEEHMKWYNKQLREIDGRFKEYMQLSH